MCRVPTPPFGYICLTGSIYEQLPHDAVMWVDSAKTWLSQSPGTYFMLGSEYAVPLKPRRTSGVIDTPFNIEQILRGCPALHEKWKEAPFVLDLDKNNNVCVRYVCVDGTKVTLGEEI